MSDAIQVYQTCSIAQLHNIQMNFILFVILMLSLNCTLILHDGLGSWHLCLLIEITNHKQIKGIFLGDVLLGSSPPQKVAIEFHLYIYNVRDYFYWNTTYLDVVRITFFCPICINWGQVRGG